MQLDRQTENSIDKVAAAETSTFSELVKVSGLRPEADFKFSKLSNVDFENSVLGNFDFQRADLRRCRWEGAIGEPSNYRFAMRGDGDDAITARDFEVIAEQSKSGRTWRDRFLAFALCVDNFGVNYLVLDLLDEIIAIEKSTYMPECSTVYFAATYYRDNASKSYCYEMAQKPNSFGNMYRIRKVRNLSKEYIRHLSAGLSRGTKTPGQVSVEDLAAILKIAMSKQ